MTALPLQQSQQRRPWWKRGSVWFPISGLAVILFFSLGIAFNTNSAATSLQTTLCVVGFVLVYVGLFIQQFKPELGLSVSAIALLMVGVTGLGGFPLTYIVVCYEGYFIASHLRVRHKLWLIILSVGSFLAITWFITLNGFIVDSTSGADRYAFGWQMFLDPRFLGGILIMTLLTGASIGLTWMWGREFLRKQLEVEELSAKAELAAVSERNRIAREMHDIVAHSLSGIIAQADGGRYAGRKEPEKALEALDTIAGSGREALTQMRGLLSTLHNGVEERSRSVSPGVSSLPDLIFDAQRNGINITLHQEEEFPELDEARGLTVYRVVQECLTNILKHAGHVDAQARVRAGESSVEIQVDNAPGDSRMEGSGRGLTGIQERVKIYGGSVRWGESELYPGGWNVTANVPFISRK